jgi:hypothetical protein
MDSNLHGIIGAKRKFQPTADNSPFIAMNYHHEWSWHLWEIPKTLLQNEEDGESSPQSQYESPVSPAAIILMIY